ncbi:MAG: hypothetical protein JXB49_27130 [Bacteroidales bacterium]|nr:hypothetical protein [Bacteroidales bacterium]
MEEENQIINTLREKIQMIITSIEDVKSKNKLLEEENVLLKGEIANQKKELDKTSKNLDTIKLAKAVKSSPEDSHDAKIKINRIVREIDKCIALLNR